MSAQLEAATHRPGRAASCAVCQRSWPCPTMRRAGRQHLVARVRFVHGQPADSAPCVCTCGYRTTAAGFARHRARLRASA